jgi:hypothetical protein
MSMLDIWFHRYENGIDIEGKCRLTPLSYYLGRKLTKRITQSTTTPGSSQTKAFGLPTPSLRTRFWPKVTSNMTLAARIW